MKREPLGYPIDALGRRVSTRLAVPFKIRARLFEFAERLNALDVALREMEHDPKIGEMLPTDRIHELFRDLNAAILESVPSVPCSCSPTVDCTLCEGKRWLSALDIRRITSQPAESSAPSSDRLIYPTPSESLSAA
jgi:hypothetical protein